LKRAVYPIFLILLFWGCTNPFHPPFSSSKYVEPTTPRVVIENLRLAMMAKDLDGYLNCLDKDSFRFYFNAQDTTIETILEKDWGLDSLVWGYAEEQLSVERMFAFENEIYLELFEIPAPPSESPDRENLFYEYILNLVPQPRGVSSVEGRAFFTLKKNPQTGLWKIIAWRDYSY